MTEDLKPLMKEFIEGFNDHLRCRNIIAKLTDYLKTTTESAITAYLRRNIMFMPK